MEIERKYLVEDPPADAFSFPCSHIEEAYLHLLPKADGMVLTKKRYWIPLEGQPLTIEFDVFEGAYEGLMLAEVEFPSKEDALRFTPPSWFGRDVTFTGEYQNSRLALKGAG